MRAWVFLVLAGCGSHVHESDAPIVLNETREAVSSGGSWTVTYTPSPDPIPQSDSFSLAVDVAGPIEPPSLAFNAVMPEHGHGMNTEPLVTPLDRPGAYNVSSLLFHMPGHWQMTVSLGEGGDAETAVFDVICCP